MRLLEATIRQMQVRPRRESMILSRVAWMLAGAALALLVVLLILILTEPRMPC